jgi:hypothetical protein
MDPTLQKLLTDLIEEVRNSNRSKKDGSTYDLLNAKKLAEDLEYLKKRTETLTESIKKANEKSTSFSKMLSPIPQTLSNVKEELDALDEAIEKTTDSNDKAALQAKKDALVNAAATADNIATLKAFGVSLKKIGTTGIQSAGAFAKGLQSGQSGIELSTGLMTSTLDMAGSAMSGAGQLAGTMGQVMAQTGKGPVQALGLAASVAGPLIGMLGENASKLAKFGVEVLSKEVEKTVKAFNDASASGAMFSQGMDDLRKYSGQAGLTVDQFSSVIKNNSKSLAESGYTVADGAKIVAGITSHLATQTGKSGGKLQDELLNLGYGFEEQASLVAQMTSDLKRTGGTATNGQMAQATVEMGKNMRIVADIMGEDAKAKMENAKKESEQYAFYAKLREVAKKNNDPGLFKRVQASMSLMDDTQRRAVIQATVLNGVVTDVGANLMELGDPARETAQAILSGSKSIQDIAGPMARYGDTFDEKAGKLGETISTGAIAGVDSLQVLARQFDSMGQQVITFNSENLKTASEAAEKTADATGKLQNSVMDAEKAAQALKIALQGELTEAIGSFATVSKQMLGEVQAMLKDLGIGKGSKENKKEKGALDDVGKDVTKVGMGITAIGGLLTGLGFIASLTGVGATAGVPMMAAGASMMTGGSTVMGVGSVMDMVGLAKGGISSGPDSGYAQKLHGTEAVVPLPDGKSIPVNLGGLELSEKMDQLISVMSGKGTATSAVSVSSTADTMAAFMKLLEDTRKDNQEIIAHLRDHKDIAQKLLYAST